MTAVPGPPGDRPVFLQVVRGAPAEDEVVAASVVLLALARAAAAPGVAAAGARGAAGSGTAGGGAPVRGAVRDAPSWGAVVWAPAGNYRPPGAWTAR